MCFFAVIACSSDVHHRPHHIEFRCAPTSVPPRHPFDNQNGASDSSPTSAVGSPNVAGGRATNHEPNPEIDFVPRSPTPGWVVVKPKLARADSPRQSFVPSRSEDGISKLAPLRAAPLFNSTFASSIPRLQKSRRTRAPDTPGARTGRPSRSSRDATVVSFATSCDVPARAAPRTGTKSRQTLWDAVRCDEVYPRPLRA